MTREESEASDRLMIAEQAKASGDESSWIKVGPRAESRVVGRNQSDFARKSRPKGRFC